MNDNDFSEDFLTKTIIYYNSWKCLNKQKNLSLYEHEFIISEFKRVIKDREERENYN